VPSPKVRELPIVPVIKVVNRSRALAATGLAIALLAVALVIFGGVIRMPIRTDGTSQQSGVIVGCYTFGVEGTLVNDPQAGIVIDAQNTRSPVVWPSGWGGRRVGSDIEIVDSRGNWVVRTGTRVSLPGGYQPDGSFLACWQGAKELP
jgi:hypothetical protein